MKVYQDWQFVKYKDQLPCVLRHEVTCKRRGDATNVAPKTQSGSRQGLIGRRNHIDEVRKRKYLTKHMFIQAAFETQGTIAASLTVDTEGVSGACVSQPYKTESAQF